MLVKCVIEHTVLGGTVLDVEDLEGGWVTHTGLSDDKDQLVILGELDASDSGVELPRL